MDVIGNPAAPGARGEVVRRSQDLAYRPDIDGLRAVAVMLVVLNHTGLRFSGGFVGVDVFFVISGFLITGLIAAQRARGAFSFRDFYLRRARRLLPALYLVMLVVLAAGYALLIPSDYSLLAESALSAAALVSNVFFAQHSGGYFSPDAASLPLLHIWSLSVEEQFYVLWPASLLLILRLPSLRLRAAVVAVVAAASFAYAQYGLAHDPVGAYFLLPARAGEFMLGAIVAVTWGALPPMERPLLANAASGSGLLLVLATATLLDDKSPFPGLTALAPCLGAALIIAAPKYGPSLVTRLLATRPFVAVGLISYSVYLWHWPLVSLLRYARHEITPIVGLGVVFASLLLGYVSWWLVERRYRAWLERPSRLAWLIAAIFGGLLIASPIVIYVQKGLPGRFPYALLTQDQLTAERGRYWRDLSAKNGVLAAGAPVPQLLIVGNSHAYDLAYALTENAFPGRIKLIETFHECFNFGHDPVRPSDAPLCAERLHAVLDSPDLRVADAIYLQDNWGGENLPGLADMIAKLRAVSSAPIYVFGPKMTFKDDVLAISKQAQLSHQVSVDGINAFAATFADTSKIDRDRALKAFFRTRSFPDTHYISTLDAQCGAALKCEVLSPAGAYLYFDAGHFTLLGSRRFGERLKAAHPELFAIPVRSRAAS